MDKITGLPPRLIVQVPSRQSDEGLAARTETDLRRNPIPNVRHLEEMGDFLQKRGVRNTGMARNLPSYHLLEVLDGDVFGAIVHILRRYADRVGSGPGFVELVEPDRTLQPSSGPSAKLGHALDLTKGFHSTYRNDLNLQDAVKHNITGKGVTVVVVDSGVEPNVLGGGTMDFRDLTGSVPSGCVDNHGHGTAMVKVIQDVAPGARVCAVRVYDVADPTLWDVMGGIITASIDLQAHVVNLSLGFQHLGLSCAVCGNQGGTRSTVFLQTLTWIHQIAGTGAFPDPVFVAATGNNQSMAGFHYPAAYKDVTLAVGAINNGRRRSAFSNYGTAKGFYVMLPGGEWDYSQNKATEWVGEGQDGGSTTYCVGTSPAAAYASALVALYHEQMPGLIASKLLDEVVRRCKQDLSPSYSTTEHGDGRLVFQHVAAGTGSGKTP